MILLIRFVHGSPPVQTFILVVDIATARLNWPRGQFSKNLKSYLSCSRLFCTKGKSVIRDNNFMIAFINKN